MNQPIDRQQKAPSNNPGDGAAFSMMLEAMSVEELTDALNDALENMTEENYDSALIDAYLDALDRKDPPPHILEAGAAYSGFEKRIQGILPEYRNRKVLRGHRRTWRVGLVAVLTIICMFGLENRRMKLGRVIQSARRMDRCRRPWTITRSRKYAHRRFRTDIHSIMSKRHILPPLTRCSFVRSMGTERRISFSA